MTSGSSTIMLCADQAWEMVVCGERVGKHVFFARLPTSQRLHHPAHFRKLSQTRRKTTSSGSTARPRRILRAHDPAPKCPKSQRPRRSVGRDVRGRLPARYGPACARCSTRRTHRPDTVSQQVAHAVVCRPTAQVPAAQNVPRPSEAPTAAVPGGDAAPGCRTISPKAGTAAVCRPIDRLDVFWSRPCCPPGRPKNIENPARSACDVKCGALARSPTKNGGSKR